MQKRNKPKATEKNILRFSTDTEKYGGYVYTSNEKRSSKVANEYQTKNILKFVRIRNKSVIDVGCGDGTYTIDIYSRGNPKKILGFDPSRKGINQAKRRKPRKKNISFINGSVYDVPVKQRYDIAVVRGVLHHLYKPEMAFPELKRIAKKVIIVEPNGYNLILKIIEKTSKYHIDHEEKSYLPYKIRKWIIQNGGEIKKEKYLGLVPFFSPDWLVSVLKKIEPFIENFSLINKLLCGNYYVVYENK